jgi:hypothetical protein
MADRPDFYDWTEAQWLAAELAQEACLRAKEQEEKAKEEALLPTCLRCGTKPSERNGYEEMFCKCGMVHCVTKRANRKNENEAAKEFKNAS